MIPLRDNTKAHSVPFVTIAIITINILIYLLQSTFTLVELEQWIMTYALIPQKFTEQLHSSSMSGFLHLPLLTSIFLHGGWFHVLFNMLYLWIFGDNIEDQLGHARFLLFYLLAGIAANLAHVVFFPGSPIPLVGASGAIAGVLGAYIITFPRACITSLIFVVFFVTVRKIPAVYFLIFWFVLQLANALMSLGLMGNSVAWWAHTGGFVAGILLMLLFRKPLIKDL